MEPLPSPNPLERDLARLDTLAHWLDNRFRIPGTNIRFGLDAVIGLVPVAGDVAGLVLSGYLFVIMARRGAGPLILLRMSGNFVADAAVGAVPVLGDLFDFGFKANTRNVRLLKSYYAEEKERPHIGWSIGLFALMFVLLLAGIIWLIGRFFSWMLAELGVW